MAYNKAEMVRAVELLLTISPRSPLDDVARKLRVERHTISRSLRELKRTTFRGLQTQAVLTEAMILLRKPNLSVKEIASVLGYDSPRAFSSMFKKHLGKTPTQMRQ
ncbi:MAG: AraC family transcriptional regulator [Acidobacteria bacterium]|nr:MAG: AraC family transcriptional regulator [Acidobacteriota bacterium]